MNTLDAVATVNLRKTEDGTIRIGETRVALESVVYHFNLGASAEEIAQKFPVLRLSEVYGAIAYFLENRKEVEEYIRNEERETEGVIAEIQSRFGREMAEFRERILSRDTAKRILAGRGA